MITVQGFETVRLLGDTFDGPTRIWASRVAQLIAGSIYIGFVAAATPNMGLGTPAGKCLVHGSAELTLASGPAYVG